MTFELRKAVLYTDLKEEPLSSVSHSKGCLIDRNVCDGAGAVIPGCMRSCEFIFFPPTL